MEVKTKIRMRPIPKAPVRRVRTEKFCIERGASLDSIARFFIEKGFHPSEACFEYDDDEYDDYYFIAEGPENDDSFNERVIQYEHKMQEYHNWYEQNRQFIEEELARRQSKITEKACKQKERYRKRLEQEKKLAEEKLIRLDKKLKKISE
jgi:hypothetical protein